MNHISLIASEAVNRYFLFFKNLFMRFLGDLEYLLAID